METTHRASELDLGIETPHTEAVESSFKNYVTEATGQSLRAIASELGMDPSAFRKQASGEARLFVETVVAVCRRFDLPFGPAFVQAGFLAPEEVAGMNSRADIRHFTDKELAREFLRRATRDESVDVPIAEDDDPYLILPVDQAGADEALQGTYAARRRSVRKSQ